MSRFTYTTDMDLFIRDNHKLVSSELAKRFNLKFSTNRSAQQLHQARKARGLRTGRTGRFYTGQPKIKNSGAKRATSTSFKKGNKPHNHQPVGTVVERQDGYLQIKVAEPNIWRLKHLVVWENTHGKLNDDQVIWFKDENPKNCDIENLELGSKAENLQRNRLGIRKAHPEFKETIKLVAKVVTVTGNKGRELA